MELFDFKTNDVISIEEMETGKEKVKVVLNPAEFFVYDFANKNNIEICRYRAVDIRCWGWRRIS